MGFFGPSKRKVKINFDDENPQKVVLEGLGKRPIEFDLAGGWKEQQRIIKEINRAKKRDLSSLQDRRTREQFFKKLAKDIELARRYKKNNIDTFDELDKLSDGVADDYQEEMKRAA